MKVRVKNIPVGTESNLGKGSGCIFFVGTKTKYIGKEIEVVQGDNTYVCMKDSLMIFAYDWIEFISN